MGRRTSLAALLAISLGTGGCTLCKPLVGAVTGPVVVLANSNGNWGGCGCDGRAIVAVFVVAAAIGAASGLVTGIISDVQYVCGYADDPTRNWWDPFATNTMASTAR